MNRVPSAFNGVQLDLPLVLAVTIMILARVSFAIEPAAWGVHASVQTLAASDCDNSQRGYALKGSMARLEVSAAYLTQQDYGMLFDSLSNLEVVSTSESFPENMIVEVGSLVADSFVCDEGKTRDLSLTPFMCKKYAVTAKVLQESDLFTAGPEFRRIYSTYFRIPEEWPDDEYRFHVTLRESSGAEDNVIPQKSDASFVSDFFAISGPCTRSDSARILESQIRSAFDLETYGKAIALTDSMISLGAPTIPGLAYGHYSATQSEDWSSALRFLDLQAQTIFALPPESRPRLEFRLNELEYVKERASLLRKIEGK
ncbi:MAG: hypothetical protein H6505_03440 [Calditrichaeota bacterium]|nr:hypothetical protein [Calditrichota bacterium]